MLCGAALITYGAIAPAGLFIRNLVQTRSVANKEMVGNSASARLTVPETIQPRVAASEAVPVKAAASSTAASSAAASSAAEMKKRSEIMKLYTQWKGCWKTRDIDALMKLYSPQVRFRTGQGASFVDYEGARTSFLMLWQNGSYSVVDLISPDLSIDGERAVLIAGQNYVRNESSKLGLTYIHRYVLDHEDIGSEVPTQIDGPASQKAPKTRKTKQWRIITSEFMSFQGGGRNDYRPGGRSSVSNEASIASRGRIY
jgi:hypothetical protein